MDFIESLLADLKVELDPGPEFYEEVEREHLKIIECFRLKDCAGVGKEMASHVLSVGRYLAHLAGSPPFSPIEFPREETAESNHKPRLPLSTQESLEKMGLLLRHVGNGGLYFIQMEDKL
jgi:hypothetical protein